MPAGHDRCFQNHTPVLVFAPGEQAEARQQPCDHRQFHADENLFDMFQRGEAAGPAGQQDEEEGRAGQKPAMGLVCDVGQADPECPEQIEIIGDRNDVGEGQQPGGKPVEAAIPPGTLVRPFTAHPDIAPDRCAEHPGRRDQGGHDGRSPDAIGGLEDRRENEKARPDDRGERRDGGAPETVFRDPAAGQEDPGQHTAGNDHGIGRHHGATP